MASFKQVNRDLSVKKVDRFVLSFYRYPENVSNILAESVRSVTRPSITINQSEIFKKGRMINNPATASFSGISIEFYDDNQSVVMDALYRQLYRQLGRAEAFNGDETRLFSDAKFDLNIKGYNNFGENIEEYDIKNAFISSINPDTLNISADSDSTISVEIEFDDLQYQFFR